MAGVYIEGIKMPVGEELLCLNIFPDGKVTNHFKLRCDGIARAFPVPPHGDLIGRGAAVRDLRMDYAYAAANVVALQPTIIPAEEEGEA